MSVNDGEVSQPDGQPGAHMSIADFLGALGLGKLTTYERLSAAARWAPSLVDKAALAAAAAKEFHHFERVRDHLETLGFPIDKAMAPFSAAYEQYHANTTPADWWQALIAFYIGDGVVADFYRHIVVTDWPDHQPLLPRNIQIFDPEIRALAHEVLAEADDATFAVERIRGVLTSQPGTAGRLNLWTRRMVGEALVHVRRVIAVRPSLATVVGGGSIQSVDQADLSVLFARLAKNYTDRMTTLGLSS
jgi:hypothetical protein